MEINKRWNLSEQKAPLWMEAQDVFVMDSSFEKVIVDFHNKRVQLIKDVLSWVLGMRLFEEDKEHIALMTINGESPEIEHLMYKETELGIIKTDYSFRNADFYLQFLPAEGLEIGKILII